MELLNAGHDSLIEEAIELWTTYAETYRTLRHVVATKNYVWGEFPSMFWMPIRNYHCFSMPIKTRLKYGLRRCEPRKFSI